MWLCGCIFKRLPAIALLFILIPAQNVYCQGILDSTFTFRAGNISTGNALDIISEQTGYNFTYNSRLVNKENETDLTFTNTKLAAILDNILENDSLAFSVIDRFIIISLTFNLPVNVIDSIPPDEMEYVTGHIIDFETDEPLPYATIGLKNRAKGTISNNNGEFGIKISRDQLNDTLMISYLGYINQEIPVQRALNNDFVILMRREFIPISEIIIKNQIPQAIISKARRSVSDNYGNTPVYLTGFYREGVTKKHELQTYSEAVLQIYKSGYISLQSDQIKVFKSRKIENTDIRDTLAVRLKAGLSTCLELDIVRNIIDFFSPEGNLDYSYRMTDIVTYDDESAFAIEFEQRGHIDIPLYKGTIYINTLDYAVLNAEFEINPRYIDEIKNDYIKNPSRSFKTWPASLKYSISYRKANERYYLSHVRGDLLFISRQKEKLFNTQFNVFFELAVTDVELNNVLRFPREERAPIHSIFSKTITSYDPLFWGNQDFLRPEDDLLKELKNMNVKLFEFSE